MELQIRRTPADSAPSAPQTIPPISALLPIQASKLPNDQLEVGLKRLAGVERKVLALLLVHLAEFDARRLYSDRGQPSLFAYCVHTPGYSEQAAYKRIQAARAARKYPVLIQHLWDGKLHLAAIVVLAPHLRADNLQFLLTAAMGKSMHELERLKAGLAPQADAADMIRALPPAIDKPMQQSIAPAHKNSVNAHIHGAYGHTPVATEIAGPGGLITPGEPVKAGDQTYAAQQRWRTSPKDQITPLSAERYLFRFSGGTDLRAKYLRACELLRRGKAGLKIEEVFHAALDHLLDKLAPERRHDRRLERAKKSHKPPSAESNVVHKSSPRSRAVPLALRDEIWLRDGGRCTFTEPQGNRCPATAHLEIDHINPYALGGSSNDPANLRILCRAHNQLLSRRTFGNYPRG